MASIPKKYSNIRRRTWLQSLTGDSNSLDNEREISSFSPDYQLPPNHIHTSKYTWYNFVPKNLWEQFRKLPNVYFLIIGVFQILPYTSNTNNIPTIYIPLTIIFFMTGIRDLYEDYKRQVSDKNENSLTYSQVMEDGQVQPIRCQSIYPGMIIRVNNGEMIPCDGLIVYSPSEVVYCNTKSLDGQSNLKKKIYLPELSQATTTHGASEVILPRFTANYEKPNTIMNSFRGSITFENKSYYLSEKHICLRSSYLMNSKFIYILSLYTGHDTKILLSMNPTQCKKTNLEKKMYTFIIVIAVFVLFLSVSLALVTRSISQKYRSFIFGKKELSKWIVLTDAFTWLLNITNLIPISLMFTLETVKFCEGKLIEHSPKMKTEEFNTIVNASSIIEELGEIQYVASDKTGTLTKNKLVLRKISDGTRVYMETTPLPEEISLFMMVAHQVYVNQQNSYEGVSLDEISILEFLRIHNNLLLSRSTKQMNILLEQKNVHVKILCLIQFTSERKRQSIIVEISSKYYLICKGADDVMLPKISQSEKLNFIKKSADEFSEEGLRTLIYAYRELEVSETLQWIQEYDECRIKGLSETYCTNKIQKDLLPLCCTGIEDQLVEGIERIVQKILDADIKFLIISGDKPETVMSIAKSISQTVTPVLSETNEYKEEYSFYQFLVFARCTPKQKEQIVSQIKGKVLAIGDGANDVSMLIRANVGVGINGKEGQSAVQSSDFGIPSFTQLDRLLFYYGLKFNKNNAVLIRYNFYKNFLFTFPLIVFSYYSFSSGVYFYNGYIAQLFNLLFTSIPIGAYSLFEQPYEETGDLEEALAYKFNRENSLFNAGHLVLDFLEAGGQSVVCSYLSFELIPSMFISPNDLNVYQSSCILLFFIVIISNTYLLMITKRFYLGIIVSIGFSIVCFVVAYSVIASLGQIEIVKESFYSLSKPGSSIILILTVTFGIIAHALIELIHRTLIKIQRGTVDKQDKDSMVKLILK